MAKGYRLIDKEGVQPFTSLLLFCGIALLISIPAAQRVKDFGRLALLSGVPIYFYVQALFMGILGLNLGATSAKRGEKGRGLIICLGGRVLLAQLLTFPYLLFERALYPGREGMIALFLLYTTIVSLLCAVASRLIEEPWKRTSSRGFFLKYTLFTIYCIAPWGFLPLLSPLGMVDSLLRGESPLLLLGYFVPFALLVGMIFAAGQLLKGEGDG
jgi:hypothetical protein